MVNGRVPDTVSHGLEQRHHNPELLKIYGKVWFLWNEVVAKEMKVVDAIAYERRVLREMVVTGYLYLSGNLTTVSSSVGTAPDSATSPAKSDDSQKTVCGSGGVSLPSGKTTRPCTLSTGSAATLYDPSQVPSGNTENIQEGNNSQAGIGHVWMFHPAPAPACDVSGSTGSVYVPPNPSRHNNPCSAYAGQAVNPPPASVASSPTDSLYVPPLHSRQTSQMSPFAGQTMNVPAASFTMHRPRGSVSSST